MNTESNSFFATLQRHRGGKTLTEASEKLSSLVAAVHETGKAGVFTLVLKVKPASKGHNAVVLTDDIKVKAPSIEPEASFWFATPAGDLQKDDPRQAQMFAPSILDNTTTTTVQPAPKQALA